jgi:type I restriction enzyme R subunit
MTVGQTEKKTQDRIVKLFRERLDYTYLGNREERTDNSNIEHELLTKFLKKKYDAILINKAISELEKVATNQSKILYDINKEVYSLLRYGVPVKENVGENKQTVWLIDWENPTKNDFYIAEEVTIKGQYDKRPDIVLYVNGIAVAVLELKRSTISVSEGIRQNLDNQKNIFIKGFFATNQIVMAGNDSEGLRYGVVLTPEKYYLTWKENNDIRNRLDKHLYAICNKERLLELIHDFIVFDMGIKKICRHNQYFGVKAAQEYLKRREGGIIWHTQGSGKSLIMIWLAKWIREHIEDSRVLIITDREELDGQIEKFFMGVNEKIYRTESGRDLIKRLDEPLPWLICSLIHKFGKNNELHYDDYLNEIFASIPKNFKVKGDFYVFVDECHRTQSGTLHDAMKKIMSNAVFIGFTGTPLLKADKKRSLEVFGGYIHTYKYDEAVEDKVVLDLQYEAREIDQRITSQEKVDQWFEAKTKGLTDYAKAELKKKWGTMQKVLSSQSRLSKIVGDILLDMEVKNRLMSGRGNAILVAGSIYEACKYYELFQENGLKKCAIVTSFTPDISAIKGETVSDEEDTDNLQKYEIYQKMLGGKEPETFEVDTKKMFVEEPGQMKLLIVVDKLLTGFDAPPATYLYIDKSMQDHGLFQAICRVNRLDGEDKDYGYIVDYKDLFKSLNKAVKEYTSGAFGGYDKKDVEGLLKDRIQTAKAKLTTSLENIRTLCEAVNPPKETIDYIDFFCGDSEKPAELQDTAQRRITLYKFTSTLVRAYANLANEMIEAGYSKEEAEQVKEEVQYYESVKTEIKLASGDQIDLKAYEPAMRHLIDTYIDAEESKKISAFEDLTIIDLIVKDGVDAVDNLPQNIRKDEKAVAEVIENNVRRLIIEKNPTNPKYYEKMSVLLDEIIRDRKNKSIDYANYLKTIAELIQNLKNPSGMTTYPKSIDSNSKRALYDNLDNNEEAALKVDEAILKNKPDDWRGNVIKEREVKLAIRRALEECNIHDEDQVELVLALARNQNDYY